jgi:hypothetical protein
MIDGGAIKSRYDHSVCAYDWIVLQKSLREHPTKENWQ